MSVASARSFRGIATPGALAKVQAVPSISGFISLAIQHPDIGPHGIFAALTAQKESGRHIFDCLIGIGGIGAATVYDLAGRYWGTTHVDLRQSPPDPRLLDGVDHVGCMAEGHLPWQRMGDTTVFATAYPDRFIARLSALQARYGKIRMVVASPAEIEAALLAGCGSRLAQRAETLTDAAESCRLLDAATLRGPLLSVLAGLMALAIFLPVVAGVGLLVLALLTMFASALLRLAVLMIPRTSMGIPPAAISSRSELAPVQDLPVISVMVALFREGNVAAKLAARLGRLDYPRDRLDVLLVVEADDTETRRALAVANLPVWMRVVVVPPGRIKTKPRALNHALAHCRGSIIGVYDAEDAPDPDQLHKVARQFATSGPEVVCLQGKLDFYNPQSNWLARCFTLEYAAWFRVFLPGIAALDLAVPLGGTTLFFRRDALERLGGWDAQNVTEDADLGLRLTRHGYRTHLLDSVTFEEANCRTRPWIKQRSRWIKGYMMTWLSHMRNPRLLWQQLGPRRFLGFQLLFLGSILQSLLAPVLWSLWPISLGLWHPVQGALPAVGVLLLCAAMIGVQILMLVFDLIGLRRTHHRINPLWLPSMTVYHMLATLAAYKALWELLTRPFYWDKTSHGLFDGPG